MVNLRKKKTRRTKHIPQRTCVGCRMVAPKRDLIRLVKSEEGIIIDPSGKMPGRGVYLHLNPDCWKKGLNGAISKELMIELTHEDKARLVKIIENKLPETNEGTAERNTLEL